MGGVNAQSSQLVSESGFSRGGWVEDNVHDGCSSTFFYSMLTSSLSPSSSSSTWSSSSVIVGIFVVGCSAATTTALLWRSLRLSLVSVRSFFSVIVIVR